MYKYPVTRTSYCIDVGDLREKRILQILKALLPSNYQVVSHSDVSANGTDIKILHHGKSLAKFEISNEDLPSYIDSKRALCIRKNLRHAKYKALICSHGNLTREAKKILKNIPILRLGFQTLPESFHAFYSKISKVFKRKIANEKSFKLLKNSILSFLFKIGFIKHMYVTDNNVVKGYSVPICFDNNVVNNNVDDYSGMGCSSSVVMCDGGSSIFPLEVEVHREKSRKGRKRVFPFVDKKKPKRHVSFRDRMRKEEKWMVYDCEDCLCYDFCYLRDRYTMVRDKLKETYQNLLDVHSDKGRGLLSFIDKKLAAEMLHREIVRLWMEGEAIKEKMWKCLKGRNRVHIFGNRKGEKKIFFNEGVNIQ